jgi:hypothetical protein
MHDDMVVLLMQTTSDDCRAMDSIDFVAMRS